VANDATPWPSLTNTHDDDKVKCVVAVTHAKGIGGKGGGGGQQRLKLGRVMKRRQPPWSLVIAEG
jgi:hypothetical protein